MPDIVYPNAWFILNQKIPAQRKHASLAVKATEGQMIASNGN